MYNDLAPITSSQGDNLGGLCGFRFVPKQWLAEPILVDMTTGAVTEAPALIAGKDWLEATCQDDTMMYEEKTKSDKAGSYIEATLSGVCLLQDLAKLVALATLPFYEFVVIYTDQNRLKRIIGNHAKGMSFAADNSTGKDVREATQFVITLTHQMPEPAPVYTGA